MSINSYSKSYYMAPPLPLIQIQSSYDSYCLSPSYEQSNYNCDLMPEDECC